MEQILLISVYYIWMYGQVIYTTTLYTVSVDGAGSNNMCAIALIFAEMRKNREREREERRKFIISFCSKMTWKNGSCLWGKLRRTKSKKAPTILLNAYAAYTRNHFHLFQWSTEPDHFQVEIETIKVQFLLSQRNDFKLISLKKS